MKLFLILGSIIFAVIIMHHAGFILIPLIYSFILAIILHPLLLFIQRWIKYHLLAYLIGVVFVLIVFVLPIGFMVDQLQMIFSELNTDTINVDNITASIKETLVKTPLAEIVDLNLLQDQMDKILSILANILKTVVSGSGKLILNFSLALIFGYFLSAYYRDFRTIIIKELEVEERSKWRKIAQQAPDIIRSYLSGMLIVMVILAILNSISLLIIGVNHAFMWGLIIGMLAIIPYLGSFIGLLLPITYSFIATNDYRQPLAILICYLVIQQIEGNFLTPKIVGDKLKVNPFIIILMILIFGNIWGLDGVIISLPLIGVAKAILEEYEGGQVIAKIISSKS